MSGVAFARLIWSDPSTSNRRTTSRTRGSDDQRNVGDGVVVVVEDVVVAGGGDKIRDLPVEKGRLERREVSEDIHKMWKEPDDGNMDFKKLNYILLAINIFYVMTLSSRKL